MITFFYSNKYKNNIIIFIYICKYCNKEFETSQKLGGHVSRCYNNPNSKNTFLKIGEKHTSTANIKIYDIECPICGKYKLLSLSFKQYLADRYSKTCSDKCAHKLAIQNTDIERKNENISAGIKDYINNLSISQLKDIYNGYSIYECICKNCNKSYIFNKHSEDNLYFSKNYCSKECMLAKRSEKLSKAAKDRNFGGLNPETTHKNYHRGYYNNIWCDSSWELAFLVYHLENGYNIKRYSGDPLNYNYKGIIKKYYPDFQIDNKLYEIKGKFYDNNYYKMLQYPDICIITKKEIQEYLLYVSTKYGKYFWEILYDK